MTERGLPSADASPACPFVAFEDDRDSRADRPDHRHRCFAEPQPAPRALAHQEAYCLSSAFPVCPVFQQWARREAAHARPGEPASASPDPAHSHAEEWTGSPGDAPPPAMAPPARRNPPRDWAAPPPWATGAGAGAAGATDAAAAGSADRGGATPSAARPSDDGSGAPGPQPPTRPQSAVPDFLADAPRESQGLAGSAADRLARGGSAADSRSAGDSRSTAPDPDLAGLVASGTATTMPLTPDERISSQRTAELDAEMSRYARSVESSASKAKRPTVSSTRGGASTKSQRDQVQEGGGPSWEQSRRYEAYPQIRSGPSMSGIPRVALLAGALALAAVGLFFLPALLGLGEDEGGTPSASPSEVVATATPEPTPTPAPTPQTYTIQEGDTLSAIAADFGLTLDELMAANEDTIEDPDQIAVGDVINIPPPPPDEVEGGASEAPAEESPAP